RPLPALLRAADVRELPSGGVDGERPLGIGQEAGHDVVARGALRRHGHDRPSADRRHGGAGQRLAACRPLHPREFRCRARARCAPGRGAAPCAYLCDLVLRLGLHAGGSPPRPHSPDAELARIRREPDLYRRLLHLGAQNDLGPLLSEALGLVVDVTGAHQGYLELHDDEERTGHPPLWIAHGFSAAQIEAVRGTISRGIIAHALATGQTVVTPSALLDPRFRDRDSVRAARIEAVLCAPIGADPPLGVLYLQGREQAGPFSEEDRANAELFTRHLAPLAE